LNIIIKKNKMERSEMLSLVSAYHGRVYSKEVLESLSDERLRSMLHPEDDKGRVQKWDK